MALSLYNSLTREIETFEPIEAGRVRMYSCGPTVYDYPHIGNWRANVFVDLLRRYLTWRGYGVFHVMNLTDVDDKTIAGARSAGISLEEYTAPFIEAFFADLDTLRIERAHVYPRATEHIPQMIELVEKLEEMGLTYLTDGSVYYAVERFEGYGRLSQLDPAGLKKGARVDADSYEKEEARDFVLWKGRKPEDGEVYWESPFGEGRPGWHLECSVMSAEYLGIPFDIHTGGVDLLFPHHENEIAQTTGATGEALARWWVHNEHLLLEGRKMSKSLGNYVTLRELVEEGAEPVAIRYHLLATHYRQQLNFRRAGLEAASASVARIRETARLWRERSESEGAPSVLEAEAEEVVAEAIAAFTAAMDADLNISEGLSAVFEMVRRGNALMDEGMGARGATALLAALKDLDGVLAVLEIADDEELPAEILDLIEQRERARGEQRWAEADRLRAELREAGVLVEDTAAGTRWKIIR